jgi:transcriptional regulator with XRE-family HTH domain
MINNSYKGDYDFLVREIIIVLRGKISQRSLSKKLGFSFNQVGKWESGFTNIKWDDFLNLCLHLNLPIENSFQLLFYYSFEKFNIKSSLVCLEKFLGLSSNSEYIENKEIKKWISGKVAPHFSSILRAFDTRPSMLIGWLSFFLDCSKIYSLKKSYEEFLLRIDTVLNDPNCVYVNAALQLRFYKDLKFHDDKLLASHAACSVSELRKTLALLNEHGIISFDGKKYIACAFDFSFSALPMLKLRSLTKYTTELAAHRYSLIPAKVNPVRTPNLSVSSVRVTAMSSSASRQVAELIAKFHNEMANIVKEDRLPKDNVQIFILHSFASNIE